MTQKPYSHIRVVELGSRRGASTCCRLLADLGATVYVIEPRTMAQSPSGKWRDRVSALAGKESVLCDPSNPQDLEDLQALISRCDVVVQSADVDDGYWPADVGRAVSQCPIVCDITAFGSTGPWAGRCGEEWELQALTGIMHTTGLPAESSVPVGVPIVEMSAGLYAASAICVALRVQDQSAAGQSIEVALYDVAINTLTTFIAPHFAGLAPRRLGNGHGMAVPWNAYATADGWILICTTNDAQWNRLKLLIGTPAQRDEYAALKSRLIHREDVDALMHAWTGTHTLDSVEALLNQAGIPCGRIVAIDRLAEEPNMKRRGSVQHVRNPVTGEDARVCSAIFRMMGQAPAPVSIPEPDSGRAAVQALIHEPKPAARAGIKAIPAQALQGLRVIELGQLTTAPLAARHLAALGAEAIKVEPPEGESARAWEPRRNGISHFFVVSNGEKRSVALDLQNAEDRDYLAELIKDADILLENMKPGALARLGFGYDQLRALNPGIIYCAISGFGIDSAYPGRAAVDTVIQAMSGIMDTTRSGQTPVKAGISAADIAGGQTGLLLVLAALAHRGRTGAGCAIDISMQDVGAWMTQHRWNGDQALPAIPTSACSVAEACTHEQTDARELIQLHNDASGQAWEVFGSPMRLSLTPARIGTLIGPASRTRLRWQPRSR